MLRKDGLEPDYSPVKGVRSDEEKRTYFAGVVGTDEDRLAAAHKLYVEHGFGSRDDSVGIQYLIPG